MILAGLLTLAGVLALHTGLWMLMGVAGLARVGDFSLTEKSRTKRSRTCLVGGAVLCIVADVSLTETPRA